MLPENVAQMELRPVAASHLKGVSRQRGNLLTVTDSTGSAVIQVTLGKAADSAGAIFETAEGRWRIEPSGHWVAILDSARKTVAAARDGEVVLLSGERLPWKQSSFPTRYRLGEDRLWVARGRWLSQGFTAKVSSATLARDDKGLLVGIASVLTQNAVKRRQRSLGKPGTSVALGGYL
jgi:hypothetical protein